MRPYPARPKAKESLRCWRSSGREISAGHACDDPSASQRVFCGKFGYDTIEVIEGNKLEIEFEKAGRKRVLDSFVSLG